jgi:Cft2 family RNA processing exonuclease
MPANEVPSGTPGEEARANDPYREEMSCLALAVGHNVAAPGQDGELCLLVSMGPYKILLDCGLSDLASLANVDVDLAWCSHAHTHSARGIAQLHQLHPNLPIYSSAVTRELLGADFLRMLPEAESFELRPNLRARIFRAGHLPGAAAIFLTYQGMQRCQSLLYVSDFFLSNTRCTEGLALEDLRNYRPDVVIVGGSQGTIRYPHRRRQEQAVLEQIDRALQTHGSLLLLAPELGTGPEIVLLMRSHHLFGGRSITLWLDEEIAADCDRYQRCLADLPLAVQNFARNQSLFWDDRVQPQVRPLRDRVPRDPGQLNGGQEIILASRPLDLPMHKLVPAAWLDRWPDATGYVLINCADGAGTTQLIHNLRPQHLVLVHGSPTYLADLTGLDELNSRYKLHLPSAGSLVELPIGDTFMQPPTPRENSYEGELEETPSGVYVTLPGGLADDSRWLNFADTGLVEARWQGEELVLRGISARQLLNQVDRERIAADLACCANCRYLRSQRCAGEESPLYGFKVTLTGVCPVFTQV